MPTCSAYAAGRAWRSPSNIAMPYVWLSRPSFIVAKIGIEGTILNALLCFTLALASAGIMTLWYEVLMKLGSPVRMLVAIMLAWALFYVFRALLSPLPDVVCVLVVICAPLALLFEVRRPLPETKNPISFFPTRVVSLPVLRMVLVGRAGGIVSSAGHGASPSTPGPLFNNPGPLFMFLTGADLFLVIQSAAAERYLRASFFFAANFAWDFFMLLGGVFYQFAPGVSEQILTTIAYLLFFAAFAKFLIRLVPADCVEVIPTLWPRAAGKWPRPAGSRIGRSRCSPCFSRGGASRSLKTVCAFLRARRART